MLQLHGSWHAVVAIATLTQFNAKALARNAHVADKMMLLLSDVVLYAWHCEYVG